MICYVHLYLSEIYKTVYHRTGIAGIGRTMRHMIRVRPLNLSLCFFRLQMLHFSALCGPNEQKFGELLTCLKVISPQIFFPICPQRAEKRNI